MVFKLTNNLKIFIQVRWKRWRDLVNTQLGSSWKGIRICMYVCVQVTQFFKLIKFLIKKKETKNNNFYWHLITRKNYIYHKYNIIISHTTDTLLNNCIHLVLDNCIKVSPLPGVIGKNWGNSIETKEINAQRKLQSQWQLECFTSVWNWKNMAETVWI